jgi:hypothetical protein
VLFSNITRLEKVNNRQFLIPSIAFITILISATPSIVYAQGNPFEFGPGSVSSPPSQSNTTLQLRSDTDWSGTYGDSTGSTTVDGHGNKDFIFSCSNTYSAVFQKKGQGPGFLTLNIVQPFNHTLTKFQEITRHGVRLLVGGSLSLTKQITDLSDDLDFSISQDSNTSSNALGLSNQPLNTTLKMTITDPNGRVMYTRDSLDGTEIFYILSNTTTGLKPEIPGKYTFNIKNLGNSPIDLGIDYGSLPSQTTITTDNVTNTRTTTAQFGTVSVSGSC